MKITYRFELLPLGSDEPEAVLESHDLLRLALDADVDVRTLRRWLQGCWVQASSALRIRRVLADRGLPKILFVRQLKTISEWMI